MESETCSSLISYFASQTILFEFRLIFLILIPLILCFLKKLKNEGRTGIGSIGSFFAFPALLITLSFDATQHATPKLYLIIFINIIICIFISAFSVYVCSFFKTYKQYIRRNIRIFSIPNPLLILVMIDSLQSTLGPIKLLQNKLHLSISANEYGRLYANISCIFIIIIGWFIIASTPFQQSEYLISSNTLKIMGFVINFNSKPFHQLFTVFIGIISLLFSICFSFYFNSSFSDTSSGKYILETTSPIGKCALIITIVCSCILMNAALKKRIELNFSGLFLVSLFRYTLRPFLGLIILSLERFLGIINEPSLFAILALYYVVPCDNTRALFPLYESKEESEVSLIFLVDLIVGGILMTFLSGLSFAYASNLKCFLFFL